MMGEVFECFSIRHERETFSPTSVHTGDLSWIDAQSDRTLNTRLLVDIEQILIVCSSTLTSLATFAAI